VYVQDVVEYVWRVATAQNHSFDAPFTAYNLNGQNIGIHTLAEQIVAACGTGECVVKPVPHEIQTIDIGSTPVNADKINAATSFTPSNDWTDALRKTIAYFKHHYRFDALATERKIS
jgi:nucleoside-diphosphate-sugar epimerase